MQLVNIEPPSVLVDIRGKLGVFTSFSLDLESPVVGECNILTALLYDAGLSGGLTGISLVIRDLFYKTGFMLHVRWRLNN